MSTPIRSRHRRLRMLAALALLACLAAFGCSRNTPGTLLAPTGIRPAPAVPTGGMWGYLIYDPVHYAGLDQAPYPPTRVEVYNSVGQVVTSKIVGGSSRRFEFDSLAPGRYGIDIRSHAFRPASSPWFTISTAVRDVGDLGLTASYDSLASECYVIGTMAGFTTAELATYSTFMDQNDPGVWTYPGSMGSTPVPAGTYRFKFVTESFTSTPNHLVGWGGDSTQVLTVPITNAPLVYGRSAATDLKVTFPSTGTYLFTCDERRLTFSIVPSPAPVRAPHGGFRRNP